MIQCFLFDLTFPVLLATGATFIRVQGSVKTCVGELMNRNCPRQMIVRVRSQMCVYVKCQRCNYLVIVQGVVPHNDNNNSDEHTASKHN